MILTERMIIEFNISILGAPTSWKENTIRKFIQTVTNIIKNLARSC